MKTADSAMRTIRFRLLTLLGLSVLIFLAEGSWAQRQFNPLVISATKHVIAPPLSQIKPVLPRSRRLSLLSDDDDDDKRPMPWLRATSPIQDSVLQGADSRAIPGLAGLAVNPGVNILGVGNGFHGFLIQGAVPDTNGAVGPTQFVQWVNESFAVFNKSDGSVAYGPANGNTLWQALGGPCAANNNLDPIAQYDKLANRWVMMMPVWRQPAYLCVAVSTTSDALNGGWNLYAFAEPVTSLCGGCRPAPDYPKWAVWPDIFWVRQPVW